MARKLVIVESPAKARTIGRYLGSEYRIAASVGHVRDLPESKLGVDVKKDFAPQYVNKKGKEKVIQELRDQAASSERTYIATDPDREGEAIAWHIATLLHIDPRDACRISFHEITQPSVRQAIATPRAIDQPLVDSQQARRVLDRLVGYELSPLLWKKIRKGLSAGRVQSVATRMVVDREAEILGFKPEEFWVLVALLSKKGHARTFQARFYGELSGGRLRRIRLKTGQEAQRVLEDVDSHPFVVHDVRKQKKKRQPAAPFTTSTLQQEASRRMGLPSKKTMSLAQQLYEGVDLAGDGATSLVTYIRTDSVRVSSEAVEEARKLIATQYGAEYLPGTPRVHANRNSAQDAHEAIRPAHFDLPPEKVRSSLTSDQYRLYKLVWDRFLASQMAACELETVTADIAAGRQIFRTTGETVLFKGYQVLLDEGVPEPGDSPAEAKADEEEAPLRERLPALKTGETLELASLKPEQKFTQPPPRYTEATLIKALEEQGIGRPSTYAPILSTLMDRKYVEKEKKFLHPTELGKVVTEILKEHFPDIVDIHFTAEMENRLDTVENGDRPWTEILKEFYPGFHGQVEAVLKTPGRVRIADKPTGETCPACGQGDLVIKEGRFGKFTACSRYPECRFTRNIAQEVQGRCPLCGSGLQARTSKKGNRFYTCDRKGSAPECPFISWDLPIEGRSCPTCGSFMVLKNYRGRRFAKCGNKDCPSHRKGEKSSGIAEEPGTDVEPAGHTSP